MNTSGSTRRARSHHLRPQRQLPECRRPFLSAYRKCVAYKSTSRSSFLVSERSAGPGLNSISLPCSCSYIPGERNRCTFRATLNAEEVWHLPHLGGSARHTRFAADVNFAQG